MMVVATTNQQRGLASDFHERLRLGTGVVPDAADWLEVGRCLAFLCSGRSTKHKLSKQEVNLLVRDALFSENCNSHGCTIDNSEHL